VCRAIAGDPDRVAGVDHRLDSLVERFNRSATTTVLDWEYLLLTARKRSDVHG
jgi:hypothetical protein